MVGSSILVIFRAGSDRASQYMGVLNVVLCAFLLLDHNDILSLPSKWNVGIVLPTAVAVVSLIHVVRLSEKSYALITGVLAGVQILISCGMIDSLK